jgi:sigma-B regulation protein RsbU (phosphoserine phosphatase)
MEPSEARIAPRPAFRVLVCDDQPDVREALRLLLKSQGWQTVTADSPESLLESARTETFDLILLDLNYTRDTTSGAEGMDLLASLETQGNQAPVMVMTAWSSFDLAVEAMRRGACDFIQKPWDNQRLLAAIARQAESERKRKSELEIAANVQQKLFPSKLRPLRTLDYGAQCVAARVVGGDYYDFLDTGPDTMAIVLADVCGKGVPAALLMANLQAWFRSQPPASLEHPVPLLEQVNRHFFGSTEPDRFATLFFGIYNERTRRLQYVNCAHSEPLLLRASGAMERLEPTATVIGAFAQWHCTEAIVELGPGDLLALYSDGVTEAIGIGNEEFGENRLLNVLHTHRHAGATAAVQAVIDAVAAFSRGQRSDDETVVILRGKEDSSGLGARPPVREAQPGRPVPPAVSWEGAGPAGP